MPEHLKDRIMERKISLTVNDQDMHFTVSLADYNKYVNELTLNNKVAPARNFLMRCVDADSREALREFVDQPSMGLQIVSALLEEYMPEVNITVGK